VNAKHQPANARRLLANAKHQPANARWLLAKARRDQSTVRASLSGDSGSIAPLALGLASLLLAMTFTFANAGALLLFQQRETQQAEALALAVAGEVTTQDLALAAGNSSLLTEPAQNFAAGAGIIYFEVETKDSRTVSAKVCGSFTPPIIVPLLGPQTAQTVCGTAKARKI